MRPSAMRFSRATRAVSRRTGSKLESSDGLGRVVDHEVDAGDLLEGADVATLAADDAALEVIGGNVHGGNGDLGGVVGGAALNGQVDTNLLSGLVALGREPAARTRE